jgi:hypothetical protein
METIKVYSGDEFVLLFIKSLSNRLERLSEKIQQLTDEDEKNLAKKELSQNKMFLESLI